MTKRVKERDSNKGKSFSVQEHGSPTNHLHPAFCLKFLPNNKYGFPEKDKDSQLIVIKDLHRLCQKSWQEIQQTPRDRGGQETITNNAISLKPRMEITPDEKYVSFYIGGNKARMVGCRRDKIFYVFWFDFDFTLYKHN